MNTYGKRSLKALESADPRLQSIFKLAINVMDISILYGNRPKELQFELFKKGREQLPSGVWVVKNEKEVVTYKDGTKKLSKHNYLPSKAVDAVPYPIDWEDRERAVLLYGIILGIAEVMGYTIRWGGDWDKDTDLHDQSFMDLYHYEIVD